MTHLHIPQMKYYIHAFKNEGLSPPDIWELTKTQECVLTATFYCRKGSVSFNPHKY